MIYKMGSSFSRFFFTFSSSVKTTTSTVSETASSSAMVLPLSRTDHPYEVINNKKKNNIATDSKRKDGDLCSSKGRWNRVDAARNRVDAARRLQKELLDFNKDPLSHCSGGPVSTNDCDIFNWSGAIFGPEDTPFEGGVFFVSVCFPKDYPFKPPSIKFETKIFHPNIDEFGNIDLDILKGNWTPALPIPKMLISICSFLDDPNAYEATNMIAKIYRDDRQKYNEIARAWTRRYAMG